MPIEVDTDLTPVSEERFKEVAYAVTGAAFDLYKEYGRLFDEKVYQAELFARCRDRGLWRIEREVRIRLTHPGFKKEYFIDFLIAGGAVFELKALAGLADEHRAQTLNYLFLTGLSRAKLFNFGADRVQHKFVSTGLTPALRRQLVIDRKRSSPADRDGAVFCERLLELLHDWGAFLQLPLYYDALVHFLGGEEKVIRNVPVVRNGLTVGVQRMHLLNQHSAFVLTALPGPLDLMEEHLRRLLQHTNLRAIQWANLHHHDIMFITLLNDP